MTTITLPRAALAQQEPRNQCGETCERAKLCAVCARELEQRESVRDMLISAAAMAVVAERKGAYQGASWVADAVLAQEQEHAPAAWIHTDSNNSRVRYLEWTKDRTSYRGDWIKTPLYTHPPRREWVSLTDEEIGMLYVTWDATPGVSMADFARAIEQALKEKNHE
jgi:hypothetical protein